MPANDSVAEIAPEVIAWRKHIHANPELGFAEHETAAFVAAKLKAFGLAVHTDVSRTAVVATLTKGNGSKAIALRAELDALPIEEMADIDYASKNKGVMHACGHDGHAAILLGTAKLLAESGDFDGTVVFIFQPAEEVVGGGRQMIEDGVLERFPVEKVFAIHNWPGFPKGQIGILSGPQMAAVDDFEIRFHGGGCHAAMPHLATIRCWRRPVSSPRCSVWSVAASTRLPRPFFRSRRSTAGGSTISCRQKPGSKAHAVSTIRLCRIIALKRSSGSRKRSQPCTG
nr:amidohydrolase [Mesorhizobium amorphae]